MVQGCIAYMVEYGPRRNGAIPAAYSRCSIPCRSSAVYHCFTGICSGVSHAVAAWGGGEWRATFGTSNSTVVKSGFFGTGCDASLLMPRHEETGCSPAVLARPI